MGSEDIDRRLSRLGAGYASHLRGAVADQHDDGWVFSPLGVWMLLAAATVGARGESHKRLKAVVGCPAPEASELLDALFNVPPPALKVALALWTRGDLTSAAMTRWGGALPSGVQVGAMPSQEQADGWVRRATLDLIERFPAEVADLVACLVSAVATRVSWEDPFDTIDAEQALAPDSPWRGLIERMLCVDDPRESAIMQTEQAGTVAVLKARALEGIAVVCVSADPDVPCVRVTEAAAQIAAHVGDGTRLRGVSLFDLALGESHSWSLTERARPAWQDGQRFERIARAALPAWTIRSSSDLLGDERFGAGAALEALYDATRITGPPVGRQEAIARFDRYGFEAAAVTLVGWRRSMRAAATETGTERVAQLRFDHPFAAVAVGVQPRSASPARWVGLPMFEAWVTSPVEPEPKRARPGPA